MEDFSCIPAMEQLRRCTFTDDQAEAVRMVLYQAEALAVIVSRALEAMVNAGLNGEDVSRELAMLVPTAGDMKRWLQLASVNVATEKQHQRQISTLH